MAPKSSTQRRMQRSARQKLEAVRTGAGCDLIAICNKLPFTLHKDVVCKQSVINSTLIQEYKGLPISAFKFKGDEPAVVQSMIEFLYTKNYTLGPDQKPLTAKNYADKPLPALNTEHTTTIEGSEKKCFDTLLHHILVNSIATKYEIPELEKLSREKLAKSLKHNCPIAVLPDLMAAALKENDDSALIHVFALRAAACIPKLMTTPRFVVREWPGYFISLIFCAMSPPEPLEANPTPPSTSPSETSIDDADEFVTPPQTLKGSRDFNKPFRAQ
ncbi:unnamed protein product [Clonostachys rosea f. rosea IK726]|uniref:Uncharacterized protein n=1 Tax=Clonostachys rosea f. rosea IK726 TaxID=1349383 RepID=A0ACA9UFS8_BIOOC|nr:unnamed protein product [Clonostachys rosea f. rosea IK726]